jgi:hypothetical protein
MDGSLLKSLLAAALGHRKLDEITSHWPEEADGAR